MYDAGAARAMRTLVDGRPGGGATTRLPGTERERMLALVEQPDPVLLTDQAINLTGAWLLAGVALLVAWWGMRRFPRGVSEALFVAGLSGALIPGYTATEQPLNAFVRLGIVLSAAAVFWFVVCWWIERERRAELAGCDEDLVRPVDPEARATEQVARRSVAQHASLVFGLVVVALAFHAYDRFGEIDRQGLLACMIALTLVSWAALGLFREHFRAFSAIGCTGVLLWYLRPAGSLEGATWLRWAPLIVSLGGLVAVLLPVLGHWQRRRFIWLTDAKKLLEAPRRHPVFHGIAFVLSVGVGVAGVLAPGAALAPLAAALAALTLFVLTHVTGRLWVGEFAFGLLAETLILIPEAWFPATPINLLIGSALAGIYFEWLARFWNQQLLNDEPWTTAGRLIPIARRWSCVCSGLTFLFSVNAVIHVAETEPEFAGLYVIGGILGVLHASMLIRATSVHGSLTLAFSACLSTLAVAGPSYGLLTAIGWPFSPVVHVAGLGLLLAMRLRLERVGGLSEVAYDAYLGGFLPLAVLHALTIRTGLGLTWTGEVFALLFVAAAIGVNWHRRFAMLLGERRRRAA